MALRSKYEKGYLRFYESTTGETMDVMAPAKIIDDFVGEAVDTTNDYVFAAVNSGAITTVAATNGLARITTGAADDDDADFASELVYLVSKGCTMEARIAQTDIDGTAINVGFSDATGEAADLIAVTFATATLTSTATDCAVFFQDPDATTNLIRAVAVATNVDGTVRSTGTTPVDTTYHTYKVVVNTDGSVEFWFDNAHVATEAAGAVAITATLCMYIAIINREGFANTLDIDYVRCWAHGR